MVGCGFVGLRSRLRFKTSINVVFKAKNRPSEVVTHRSTITKERRGSVSHVIMNRGERRRHDIERFTCHRARHHDDRLMISHDDVRFSFSSCSCRCPGLIQQKRSEFDSA